MTYEKAVGLYNELGALTPADYLFDGKENMRGVSEAVIKAFGIVHARPEGLCYTCTHEDDCPFRAYDDEVYAKCNFHEEVSR